MSKVATPKPRSQASSAVGRPSAAAPLALACLLIAAIAPAAHAALGQSSATVEADRAHFAARAVSTAGPGFAVQTLTAPNGGVVREYSDPSGVVFAVAWRGPGLPDLRQLLGDRYAALQAGMTRRGPRTKAPLAFVGSDFVIRNSGHPGAFFGHAYLPQSLPAGFSLATLN